MRVLALDVGERRIGVAISDPDGRVAVPLQVLTRSDGEADLAAIRSLAEAEAVDRVIVGLPLSLRGERGGQARLTEAFAQRLQGILDMPVELWDERLSSVEAQRRRAGPHPARRGRRRGLAKDHIDALAAAIILQSYLDSHRQG